MKVTITPATLRGSVPAIPSKSDVHRKLIGAALANRTTSLSLPRSSADMDATMECLRALGAKIDRTDDTVMITPINSVPENPVLDCGESGSTFRFLLPVASALSEKVTFQGHGRLPQRPIGELMEVMQERGVTFSAKQLPFTTKGRLQAGDYRIPGNISSQYITGLLLALPLLDGDSTITLSTPLTSAAYVEITRAVLDTFGVTVQETPTGYRISGKQAFRSQGTLSVSGDWSNAAFFLTAGALSDPITVSGLDEADPQGDKEIVPFLRQFGANVSVEGDAVTVQTGKLTGTTIDIGETPDLLPILAVLATQAEGETCFTNAARLRLKESDRLKTTTQMLKALGGDVEELPDGLLVRRCTLTGGETSSYQDHRIAMAAAVAAIVCDAPVTITDAEAVDKSYPQFYEDYEMLGGNIHVI